MYSYIAPDIIWSARDYLIGKSVAYAYWHRHAGQNPEWYRSAFRVLRDVTIGPHAYTLIFDDKAEELISYDWVCFYTVGLEKS